ncbi:MAG: hypothetical protein U0271_15330 [Polyangiaceae bacterium]
MSAVDPKTLAMVCLVACSAPPASEPVATRAADSAERDAASNHLIGEDVLYVGEAVLIEGDPVAEEGNPSAVLDYRSNWKNRLIVNAVAPGEGRIRYVSAAGAQEERRFRVLERGCRERPLHPVIRVQVGDHAILDMGGASLRSLDAVPRGVVAANGGPTSHAVTVDGMGQGHGSVMLTGADGAVQLFDVFVGETCAEKNYTSIVPSIPPGALGPKGDGSCVRREASKGRVTAAACPDRARLSSLTDEELSPVACEWAASCGRMGNEGCCVGCTSPWPWKLSRKCALSALAATSCAEVQRIVDAPDCSAH